MQRSSTRAVLSAAAESSPRLVDTGDLAPADADEFLIPLKDETLPDILADFRDQAGLAVPWSLFGSNGHDRRPAGLVLENYTRRAPHSFVINRHIKCLMRPQRIAHLTISYMAERERLTERWHGAIRDWPRPLTLAWGMRDPVARAEVLDGLRALRPGVEVIELPDAGHYPQIEQPDRIAEALDLALQGAVG